MITVNNLSLIDVAAKSTLTDKTTKWIYESIDYAINKRYMEIFRKFWLDLENLTEKELDYLLWEYHVDYIGEKATTEIKKELIRKSITSHFNKGTLGSIKTICAILFGNAEISEWFEYGGNPGYFKIKTSGNLNAEIEYLKIIEVINAYKNVRSWLESLGIVREKEINLNFGDYKKYKIKYYLGSTNMNIPNQKINNTYGIVHRTRYLANTR